MTAIAPQMRLEPALAAQLLDLARRGLLATQHDAMKTTDPGEARRLNARAEHLRNRVSRLKLGLPARGPATPPDRASLCPSSLA